MAGKVIKTSVFVSSFAIIAGSLLLFTSYFEQFTFKPSVEVKSLVFSVDEEEKTLGYNLIYTAKKDHDVSVRLKNEFFNIEERISIEAGEDIEYCGYFTPLTSKAKYTFTVLEKNIEIYQAVVTLVNEE